MNSVNSTFKDQVEVKKSKFISYLVPIKEYKILLATLKKEHPKASHIIYAYRELNEFDQVVENSTDDGEPKGAAGVPTLNQLRGANLINCAILTVRYFGGTKLGVGGMVRAYSSAAKSVVLKSNLVPFEKLIEHIIEVPYNRQRQIEYHFKNLNIIPINREFLNSRVCYTIKISKNIEDKLIMLGVIDLSS